MAPPEATVRLFIGTPIEESTTIAIAEKAEKHVQRAGIRWAPRSQWHVTALFLGEREATDIPFVLHAMEQCAERHHAVDLLDGRLVAMPEAAPSMVWVRFSPHPGLTLLHHQLAEATSSPPSPYTPYWPHITLARGKRIRLTGEEPLMVPHMMMERLVLFRSDPAPGGRIHVPLGSALLL